MSPGRRVGVLADDLTGAGDTALQFHRMGQKAWVFPRLPQRLESVRVPLDVQVLSLNTASRNLSGAHAADQVRRGLEWLDAQGCEALYLKVDSTLRGQLGVSAEVVRRMLAAELAVVAPAFPEAGRITVGGYQLVEGTPVSLSPYALDPLAPAHESYLPAVLAQGNDRVALLELKTVWQGPEAIASALIRARRDGARMVAVDASRREDLNALAWAIRHVPFLVLPVGSAGLAQALCDRDGGTRILAAQAPRDERLLSRAKPVLIVNGSANPTSLAQIRQLAPAVRTIRAEVSQLLLTGDEEVERLLRQAAQGLVAGLDVVLTTATSVEGVLHDQGVAAALGLSAYQLGMHLTQMLGRMVPRLIEAGAVSNLVVIGGETASAVCQQLAAEGMEIESEVLPAIPAARVVNRTLRVVTKSGGFGALDALGAIVARLKESCEVQSPR